MWCHWHTIVEWQEAVSVYGGYWKHNSNDLVLVHPYFFWEPGPIIPLCRFSVGQNLAKGYGEWLHVVQAWFDEQANFTYGNKASNVFEDVGHYTQVCVRAAGLLGCSPTFSSVGQKASSVGAEVAHVFFLDFISFGNYIYVCIIISSLCINQIIWDVKASTRLQPYI